MSYFQFLREETRTAALYEEIESNWQRMVGYIDQVTGRIKKALAVKDVQYLVAFREQMVAMNTQIETLKKEVKGTH